MNMKWNKLMQPFIDGWYLYVWSKVNPDFADCEADSYYLEEKVYFNPISKEVISHYCHSMYRKITFCKGEEAMESRFIQCGSEEVMDEIIKEWTEGLRSIENG